MQDHPLPQDITGYQFHIIGNMTLKQFAEVGVGVFIAFLFYTTNLAMIIKWPLIGLSVGLGVIAAFVPIEERPFDQWISSFFKAIYKPTKFFWKKDPKIPDFFLYQPQDDTQPVAQELDLSPAKRQRIKEFMFTIHQPPAIDPLEEYQNNRIGQIIQVFDTVKVSKVEEVAKPSKPDLTVRVRDLKAKKKKQKLQEVQQTQEQFITQRTTDAQQIATDISIPDVEKVKVANLKKQENQQVVFKKEDKNTQAYVQAGPTQKVEIDQSKVQNTSYNRELPFPSPPTEPNIPVGMTIDENGHLVSNAIVEIISQTGSVVRAVKTNSLGQFFVTTPLADGSYTIQAEKGEIPFPPIKLEVLGKIIEPIEIRATTNVSDMEEPPKLAEIN